MSVGRLLREAREERELSVAEVSEVTKIQPWVLRALEDDRLQEQMSPIYVRGFVTRYARFLHLDPSPLIATVPSPVPPVEEAAEPPAVRSWRFALPAVRVPQWSLPHLRLPSEAISRLRRPWEVLRRIGPVLGGVAVVAALIVLKPTQWLPSSGPARTASVTPMHEPPKAPPAPMPELAAAEPLVLSVTTHRRTWVQVRADGKLLAQRRLERGATERWNARHRFELVVANPAHVELALNDQSISPLAVAHQGRLLITHRGVHRLPSGE